MGIIWHDEIEVMETERLILRKLVNQDAEYIFRIFSDEEVAKYDIFYPIETIERAKKIIENYENEFNEREEITWGVQRKDSGEIIGVCSLGEFIDSARRSEIGYDIARSEWNKGYGTEAISAVVEYGFNKMNLNRIEAFITPGNEGSVRVLEKVRFQKEGLVRERDLIKGKLEDGILMARLKSD